MNTLPKLTLGLIKAYQAEIARSGSTATAKRKMVSLKKFLDWAAKEGKIQDVGFKIYDSESKNQNERISAKKAVNTRFSNLYKRYRSIPGTSYLNIAILVILSSALGLGIYNQFFKNTTNPFAATSLIRPNRYLSFQGRLTNQFLNPITAVTSVVFTLYDAASAGTTLWTGTCDVTPDTDGVFSTLLGSDCGSEISSSVFSDNASVWLGVKVAADAEATPRIQIATVAYALNSETLKGYPASSSATINTVPVVNNSGQIVLAVSSPKIQSTTGTFAIEGQAITIQTPSASNGNVTIAPDGTGQLNLTFTGASPGSGTGMVNATDANLTSGSLYYGSVASDASGYNLLQLQSGSSLTNKFVVDSAGNSSQSGTLTFGGTATIQSTASRALTLGGSTTGNITLNPLNAVAGGYVAPNTTNVTDLGTSSLLFRNIYGTTLYQGTNQVCDESNNCNFATGTNYWQLNTLTLSPANNTYDLAIGGTATSSAKFQAFALEKAADATSRLAKLNSSVITTGTLFEATASAITSGNIIKLGQGGNSAFSGNGLYMDFDNTGGGGGTFTGNFLKFDDATTTKFTVDASGNVGGAGVGQFGGITTTIFSRFGTAASGHALSVASDVLVGGKLELDGTFFLDGGTIANSAGTGTITFSATPTTSSNALSASNWLIENTANVGQAALIVNQQKAGDIFTASASGTPKFTIQNDGDVNMVGDITVGGGNINTGNIAFVIGDATTDGITFTTDGTGNGEYTFSVDGIGDADLDWGTGAGQIDVTDVENGSVNILLETEIDASSELLALMDDETGTGALVFANTPTLVTPEIGVATGTSLDLGGTTLYASRAITVDTGGVLNISLATAAGDDFTVDTNKLVVEGDNGNVGIGTATPGRTLDVVGNWGGNVVVDTSGAVTETRTITTKALMYDLQKNTGTTNTSTTTTWNITGLPDTDGTFAFIYSKVEKGITGSPRIETVNIQINGVQKSSVETLTTPAADSARETYIISRTDSVWHLAAATTANLGADLAEWFPYVGQSPQAGELVSINENQPKVNLSTQNYDDNLIGIVTTKPYITMGKQETETTRVALSGQVPVIVTTQNGQILNGDSITSSGLSLSGVGMKATNAGRVVGKALESTINWNESSCPTVDSMESIIWPEDDGTNPAKPCFTLPDGTIVGKIMVFVNPTWDDPFINLTSVDDLIITQSLASDSADIVYRVKLITGEIVNKIGAFGKMIAANIKAGAIEVNDLIAQNIASKIFKVQIITPLPDQTDVAIRLGSEATPSGKFSVQDITGTEMAAIDNLGNATFDGQVTSDKLQVTTEATISGTLFADNIKSKSLDEIQALLTEVKSDQDLLKEAQSWNTNIAATDLYITNQAAINSLSVAQTVTIGSDLVFGSSVKSQQSTVNSINSLSAPLEIQSLAMAPLEIMAGLVTIDTHGNVNIAGDLFVAGEIRTQTGFKVQDSGFNDMASIDASGSAKFGSILTPQLVIAGSDATVAGAVVNGVITTNSTIGHAQIPAGTDEIAIKNQKVTDYTLIYVTPTSSTNNNVLYVKSKQAGQFTVGFANAVDIDVNFNWWIVQVQ